MPLLWVLRDLLGHQVRLRRRTLPTCPGTSYQPVALTVPHYRRGAPSPLAGRGAILRGIATEAVTASVSAAAMTASDIHVGICTTPLESSLMPTNARMAARPERRKRKRSTTPSSRK